MSVVTGQSQSQVRTSKRQVTHQGIQSGDEAGTKSEVQTLYAALRPLNAQVESSDEAGQGTWRL